MWRMEDGWIGSLNGLTIRAPIGANNDNYDDEEIAACAAGGTVMKLQLTFPALYSHHSHFQRPLIQKC